MTEDDLQRLIIDTARMLGWRCAHFRVALTSRGWRTPVSADGKGFPDLILVRERVIVAELKSDNGATAPEQKRWLEDFRGAGIETYIWRPVHWHNRAIIEALRRRAGEPPEDLLPAREPRAPQVRVPLRVLESGRPLE